MLEKRVVCYVEHRDSWKIRYFVRESTQFVTVKIKHTQLQQVAYAL